MVNTLIKQFEMQRLVFLLSFFSVPVIINVVLTIVDINGFNDWMNGRQST